METKLSLKVVHYSAFFNVLDFFVPTSQFIDQYMYAFKEKSYPSLILICMLDEGSGKS